MQGCAQPTPHATTRTASTELRLEGCTAPFSGSRSLFAPSKAYQQPPTAANRTCSKHRFPVSGWMPCEARDGAGGNQPSAGKGVFKRISWRIGVEPAPVALVLHKHSAHKFSVQLTTPPALKAYAHGTVSVCVCQRQLLAVLDRNSPATSLLRFGTQCGATQRISWPGGIAQRIASSSPRE